MATGDIKNNLRKLVNSLKGVKYEKDVDYESLANGVSTSYLPIYHFAFMDYSRAIATEISGLGIELLGRSDQRFIEGMYKVLREIFSYKPPVTRDQFFSNGYCERKVIMATEILNMLIKRHKAITPKPKVRVNISMNTTASSSLHSKQKPKSAPTPAPQKTQVPHKKTTSAKRPCSTVLPQVVSEVRDPPERTLVLLSDTACILPNPSQLLDMSPLPAAPSGYNPAVYSSLAAAKQRQDSVEIVSLNDESELSDLAIRPIDVVKTPGRPLVESHRAPPPPLHPVTSSPVEPQLPPSVRQKLASILQENESLASQLKDLTKKMDVNNQEKENLAARVTILENRVQLLEHKSSQSTSRPTLETPVEEDMVEVPGQFGVQTSILENHDQKEDKENRNSSIYDSPCVKSVHEQITELAKVLPVQAATEPSKQNLLCSETNGSHVVDEQAERIKNMMKDTQNLLGMNDSLTSEQ